MTALLLLVAALVLPPSRPVVRLGHPGPKTPRDGPRRDRDPDRLAGAADLELFAACLRAGLSPAAATAALAEAGADAVTRPAWRSVAALLAIGVSADRAWTEVADIPGLGDLAGLATLSGRSGAAMADACGRLADALLADAADQATARAERAGVLIALPLTLCFLPAFLVLGLAPVVIGLGTDLLTH